MEADIDEIIGRKVFDNDHETAVDILNNTLLPSNTAQALKNSLLSIIRVYPVLLTRQVNSDHTS